MSELTDPHGHSHEAPSTAWRFAVTIGLNFIITAVEVAGGIVSGSLSLVADALHNLSDGVAVIITWIAMRLKAGDNTPRHTFGLKRAEILAAVINASVLLVVVFYLFYHSIMRLMAPEPIRGGLMILVAAVGLVANIVGTFLLRQGSRESMNIRSAYLHLLSDAVGSAAVIAGGLAIYLWNVTWVDPVLTILIGLYILKESWAIVTQALHLLMEGTPSHISLEDVQEAVESLPEVEDLHHVHVWAVGEDDIHMEAHVNVKDMPVSATCSLRERLEHMLDDAFGINHLTVQFECEGCEGVGLISNGRNQRGKVRTFV